jgi:membrane protein
VLERGGSRVALYAEITWAIVERTLRERFRLSLAVTKHAAKEYGRDKVSRMAAAVSYRTFFALAPMLVVAVSIAGLAYGGNVEAQQAVVETITEVAGPAVGEAVSSLLDTAFQSADTAALIGIAVLLWSSSTLFAELQRSLNDIFDMPLPEEKRVMVVVGQRAVGILWTLGVGLLLIGLFVINAAAQFASENISRVLELPTGTISFSGFVVSFVLLAVTFALVFQTLTIGKIPWKAVRVGAAFTAVAFAVAGLVTGLYFELFGEPTALGVSSSIVVLLFLANALSSVFMFGAQISHSYWVLVYDADESHLLFLDEAEAAVSSSVDPPAVSIAAIAAFLVGVFVGRVRRK